MTSPTTYLSAIEIPRPQFLGDNKWQLSALAPITVLFGKNGSGKSILLRALRDKERESAHYILPERTGDMGYDASFFTRQISQEGRRELGSGNFNVSYRTAVISRLQSYIAVRGNIRGDTLPGDPSEIENFVSRVLPDFDFQIVGTGGKPYEIVRSSDGEIIGGVHSLSSGEAQLLTMAIDAVTIGAIWDLQKIEKRLLLIDEPDAHIHPDLQVRFADFLVAVSRRYKLQLIIATHSTSLLAALGQFGGESAAVIYLDRSRTDFAAVPFTRAMKELAACLGGHALMGPLFGVPLLLVEGDDDYRIWSQVPRHHVTNFSVIPCGGEQIKQYQKALEKLLGSLRADDRPPAGYALIDRDKGKPRPQAESPQRHIRFIQLVCHESENLYLADETLALLNIDWVEASAKIATEAGKYGNKSEKLREIAKGDRKTVNLKNVMEELTRILDQKNVHWTIRVAKAIGTQRPAGQLADFLGDEVINALWR